MKRNPCLGWRNGDPVTLVGLNGRILAQGIARVWTARTSGRRTVKVQETSPKPSMQWVWPDGWVLGQGSRSGACLQCDQPYFSDDDSGFCPACNRDFQRDVQAASDIQRPLAYMHGARTPHPKATARTEEELAAIAAQQAEDKEESPFG